MTKLTTADRLKQIMFERDLKQSDIIRLAEPYAEKYKTKIGRNDISQYVSGKVEPRQTKLFILAKALCVNEAWLMGYDVDRNPTDYDDAKDVVPDNQQLVGTPYNPIVHQIPVLGYISAGLPLYAEDHIEDYTYTERNGGAEYFALRVKGDSMSAAKINDGDLLIVRRQDIVENGEIAVVMVGNENATVKRFRREGNLIQLTPQSYNPEHQVQVYDPKKVNVRVIGKVVECKIEF